MSWNLDLVPAHALRRRTVLHVETLIRDVSFVPFFNRKGRVKRVVTIVPDRAGLGLLPREVVLPRISPLGRIRIPRHVPLFCPIRRSELDELCSLWHFDPWWLLDEAGQLNHCARVPLKATNCVPWSTQRLILVLYRNDLSAATTILYKPPAGGFAIARWRPHFLPEPPPESQKSCASHPGRWILDPIWTRDR